jgi:tetratricopeptide (TPR) repeat protein
MLTKKNMPGILAKLSSYIILLLLSQSAAAIPSLYSVDDAQNAILLQKLTTFSVMDSTSSPSLIILKNPQQAEQVLQNLEKQFRETGELRNIIALAPRITELLPDSANIKYLHAIALAAQGEAASARQLIKQQDTKDGSTAAAYAFMAQATLAKASDKLSEASAAANKALSLDAEHPYPYNLLGQIEAAQKNYAKAQADFQTAVRKAPNFAAAWSNLGATQLLQGDPGAAEISFSTAIKLSPNYCAPRIGHSTIMLNSGYMQNAIADLEACIKTEPEQLQANKQLAALYIQVARLDDAKKIALSLTTREPAFSKTVLADIYLRKNQPKQARKQLQAIAAPNAQTHYLLAFCDMFEGQDKSAIKHIKQAEKLLPDSATLQIASLVFSFNTGKPVDQKSLKKLSKDVAIGELALFLAGNVQASSGNMKEAYRLWGKAEGVLSGFTLDGVPLKDISKSITAKEQRSLALGMLYYLKNFYPASLSAFNEALAINSDSFLANYFAANANVRVNNKSSVNKYLKRSLDQAPGFFPANYMLAEAYLQSRDIDSAIKYYQAAADSKADGGVLIKLGLLYEQKKRKKDAVAAYKKFIEHYADNFIGYNQLAWMYARDGEQLDEALKLAKKADELQPGNASVNDTLGWIYFQKNEYLEAKRHLSIANKVSKGNDADVLYHLASLEFAMGKSASAKTLVEKALGSSTNFESISQAKELLKKLQSR